MATEPLHPEPRFDVVAPAQAAAPFAGRLQMLRIDDVRIPLRRLRGRAEVDNLRESIAAGGLLQPIVVDERLELVCGLHRVEACKQLGWELIPAIVRALPGLEAALAEIDENLCRRELTALERAEHLAKRKKVWLQLRAEREAAAPANDAAMPAGDGADAKGKDAKAKGKKEKKPKPPSRREEEAALAVFVDETARRTGRGEATVREELRIGELPDEVRDMARETPLQNNRKELLALARLSEDERVPALERVRSGEAKSVRKSKPKKPEALFEDEQPAGEGAEGVDPSARYAGEEPPSTEEIRDRLQRMLGEGDGSSASSERTRPSSLEQALDECSSALEHALSLWPDDEDLGFDASGEPAGSELLRQALRAVKRVRAEAPSARR